MPGPKTAKELGYTKVNGVWLWKGEPVPADEVEALGIADAEDFRLEGDPADPESYEVVSIQVGGEWIELAPTPPAFEAPQLSSPGFAGIGGTAQGDVRPVLPAVSAPALSPRPQAAAIAPPPRRSPATAAAAPPPGTFEGQGGLQQLALAGRQATQPGGLPALQAAVQASRNRSAAPVPQTPMDASGVGQFRAAYDGILGEGALAAAIEMNDPAVMDIIAKLATPKAQPAPSRESLEQYATRLFIEGRQDEALRVMDFARQPSVIQQQEFELKQGNAQRQAQVENFNRRMQLATSPADQYVLEAMQRGERPAQIAGGRLGGLSPYLGLDPSLSLPRQASSGPFGSEALNRAIQGEALTQSARDYPSLLQEAMQGGGGQLPPISQALGGEVQPIPPSLGPGPVASVAQQAMGGISPQMEPFQAGQAMNTYGLEGVLREQLRQRGGQLPQTGGIGAELGELGPPPIEQVFGSQPLEELMRTYGLEAVLREQRRIRGGGLAPLGQDQGQGMGAPRPFPPALTQEQGQALGAVRPPSAVLPQQLAQRGAPPPVLQSPSFAPIGGVGQGDLSQTFPQTQPLPLVFRSAQARGNFTPSDEARFRGVLATQLGANQVEDYLEQERRATMPGPGLGGGMVRRPPRRIR